jgi:RNA polymerase sigma factor (TIGR02999 family)
VADAPDGHPEASEPADLGEANALFAVLYAELHAIAERELRRADPGATLSPTTLLHEAYLKLAERADLRFADRSHFLGYACRVMRRLLIDFARRHRARKRGGEFVITALPAERAGLPDDHSASADRLKQIGEAIDTLAGVDPWLAQLVDLHVFCGMSLVELAALRGVSDRTVQRDWQKARLLLHRVLEPS